MKPAHDFRVLGQMVRDTVRQSFATGIAWLLLAASLLAIGVCLTAHVDAGTRLAAPGEQPDFLPRYDHDAQDAEKIRMSGVAVVSGELRLCCGAIRMPLTRDARSAVEFLQVVLAGGIADTLGLLLTLIWTAGFLPGFLDGRSVTVLLAKPTSRWALLGAKFAGVLLFVLANATLFVMGTWLALGWRTGIWTAGYLVAIPLLLLHFVMFFSVSALLAVLCRSTVVCVLGSIAFWGVAWSINYGRHTLLAATQNLTSGEFSSYLGDALNLAYWVLPKPTDVNLLLFQSLHAEKDFAQLFHLDTLESQGFSFTASIITSLLSSALILILATREFEKADY